MTKGEKISLSDEIFFCLFLGSPIFFCIFALKFFIV